MIEKIECTCIEAYTTRKMRDPNCCACSCDHNDLVEQLAKANERVKELEEQRESNYESWQAKYQHLKDSMRLINCYECGTPVHELSPRSRCCICEYGRAEYNAKENEQLRKEQEK